MLLQKFIRYVALGDSYTVGTGAAFETSWPFVLTDNLRCRGVAIELVGNLARNGWTTQDVLTAVLSECRSLRPDFVTLLIGTNDWVKGVSKQTYRAHLKSILDHVLDYLIDSRRVVALTSPDFSLTPCGELYSEGRDISLGMAEFNAILTEECRHRHILTIDLFTLSSLAKSDASFISPDGLHPSTRGYAQWVEFMEPHIYKHLINL